MNRTLQGRERESRGLVQAWNLSSGWGSGAHGKCTEPFMPPVLVSLS